MKPFFLAASVLLACVTGFTQQSRANSQAYPALDYGYGEHYCSLGGPRQHIQDCLTAGQIAAGDALNQCYSDGNPVCDIIEYNVVEKLGSCATQDDKCTVDAVAVPYKVANPRWVGSLVID